MIMETVDDVMAAEWKSFCETKFEEWKKTNLPGPIYINRPSWMVDDEAERNEKWQRHFHPIGEEWFKRRGYRLIWTEWPNPLQVELITKEENML